MILTVKYGSHLPVLIKLVQETSGSILEMGMGLFSTPFLHWACSPHKRLLVSYENDLATYNEMKCFQDDYHKVIFVKNWDDNIITIPWDVVLIDHAPSERRKKDIEILSEWAKYIIVHDTCGKVEKHYQLSEIWGLFKYRYDYHPYENRYMPCTTILSNLVDLKGLKI